MSTITAIILLIISLALLQYSYTHDSLGSKEVLRQLRESNPEKYAKQIKEITSAGYNEGHLLRLFDYFAYVMLALSIVTFTLACALLFGVL